MSDPIVGIDLGTSNSVLAVADEAGEPRVVSDKHGHEIQPSVVSFHPSGAVMVGARAKQRRVIDPENTIYSAKRLIGRVFGSREVAQAAERVPFVIKKGVNQQPVVVCRGGEFSIPEITGIVLDHMRGLARAELGDKVSRAVVTVPANFTDAQRSATITAGQIAGLEIVQVINEPTAAALAYGHRRQLDRVVAVYDFGGGTFDVTLLQVKGSVYEVLATAGDPFLGGDDIDERVARTLVERFQREHGIDLSTDVTAMQRLRSVSEQIKVELSRRPRAMAKIDQLAAHPDGRPIDFLVRITREEVEREVVPILARSFSVCQQALELAGLSADQVEDVILVGGTTKMPLVRARVGGFFATEPRVDVSPDAAVALGAALHAHGLRGRLGDRARRDTARGAVVPPAPPMEARVSFRNAKPDSDFRRGSTVPRLTPWDGIKGLDGDEQDGPDTSEGVMVHLDTMDIPTVDHGTADTPDGDDGGARPMATTAGYRQPMPGGREYVALRERGSSQQPTLPTNPAAVEFSPVPPTPADTLNGHAQVPVGRPPGATANGPAQVPAGRLPGVSPDGLVQGPAGRPPGATTLPGGSDAPGPGAGHVRDLTTLNLEALGIEDHRDGEPTGARPLDFDGSDLDEAPTGVRGSTGGLRQSGEAAPLGLSEPGSGTLRSPVPGPQAPTSRSGPNRAPPAARAQGAAAGSPTPAHEPGYQPGYDLGDAVPASMSPAPVILDVTPYSLGVGTVSGYCRSLLERNSHVPAEIQEVFTTSKNLQSAVRIQVCQGESHRINENVILGDLILDGIEPRPRGETRIEVTFHIDESGVLRVRACDLHTGQQQNVDFRLLAVPTEEEVVTSTQRLRALQLGDAAP